MNKMPILSGIIGIAVVATLTGCAKTTPHTDTQRQIGMANPASVYCLSQKGQLDNVKTSQGITSFCTLPSGERIDEWKLFRRDHPQT